MGSLGKKKGDKIKRALTDFSGTDSDHAVVAGTYYVQTDIKENCREQ